MTNTIDLVVEGNRAYMANELEGIKVEVDGSRFIKRASTELEKAFLRNEAGILSVLSDSGIAPQFIAGNENSITVEYLGKSQPVTDEVAFRRNCARLLLKLQEYGIRHGDITAKNIIVRNNKPYLVDFHQSKFAEDAGPDKRPEGDNYLLWEAALVLSPDNSRHIRKWRAIRPELKGGVLFDAGCAEGDWLLMARPERKHKHIIGIDKNENDANTARQVSGCPVIHADLTNMIPEGDYDDVYFMSVYAHIVRARGHSKADEILEALISMSKQLFFETQLTGDGPGVHESDDDVYNMLKHYGKVDKLVTIPVHLREPFARSVWRVS